MNLFVHDIYGGAGVNTPTSSYSGGGAFPPFSRLFSSVDAVADGGFIDAGTDPLAAYDVVMMACQGSESAGRAVTSAEKQGLKTFVDTGGRAFLAHYNYSWLRGGLLDGSKVVEPSAEGAKIDQQTKYAQTPFPPVAVWEDPTAMTYAPGGDGAYLVDTSFPNGSTMSRWLFNVGASTTQGQITSRQRQEPCDLRPRRRRAEVDLRRFDGRAVHLREHARGEGEQSERTMRKGRAHRHSRRRGRQRLARALSRRLRFGAPDRAGEGPRIHALRSVLLRLQRDGPADAAGDTSMSLGRSVPACLESAQRRAAKRRFG